MLQVWCILFVDAPAYIWGFRCFLQFLFLPFSNSCVPTVSFPLLYFPLCCTPAEL